MTTSASSPIPIKKEDLTTFPKVLECNRYLSMRRSVPGNARLLICQEEGLRGPCLHVRTKRGKGVLTKLDNFRLDLPRTPQQVILRFLTGPGGQILLKWQHNAQEQEKELRPSPLLTLGSPDDQILSLDLTTDPPSVDTQPQTAKNQLQLAKNSLTASGQAALPQQSTGGSDVKPQKKPETSTSRPPWMKTGLWAAVGLALALLAAAALAWRQRKSS